MTTAIAEAPPEGGTVTTTPDGVLPARAGHRPDPPWPTTWRRTAPSGSRPSTDEGGRPRSSNVWPRPVCSAAAAAGSPWRPSGVR